MKSLTAEKRVGDRWNFRPSTGTQCAVRQAVAANPAIQDEVPGPAAALPRFPQEEEEEAMTRGERGVEGGEIQRVPGKMNAGRTLLSLD